MGKSKVLEMIKDRERAADLARDSLIVHLEAVLRNVNAQLVTLKDHPGTMPMTSMSGSLMCLSDARSAQDAAYDLKGCSESLRMLKGLAEA